MDEITMKIYRMPRVEWFGITILEPSTVFTNLVIAVLCWYAWRTMSTRLPNMNRPQQLIRLFFLLMCIATVVGGVIGHAFLYRTGMIGKIPGWYISMAAVAVFERAAIAHGRPLMKKNVGRFFSILNIAEITLFMLISLLTLNFLFVKLHAIYGLFVVVFCFELYIFRKTNNESWHKFFTASVWGLCAAICHAIGYSISPWFNYNDISHLFMLGALWYYYQAALVLKTMPDTR